MSEASILSGGKPVWDHPESSASGNELSFPDSRASAAARTSLVLSTLWEVFIFHYTTVFHISIFHSHIAAK